MFTFRMPECLQFDGRLHLEEAVAVVELFPKSGLSMGEQLLVK